MDGPATDGKRVLVIGVGNTLRGDDGIGVHVARALASLPLPEHVEVFDGGTEGLSMLFEMQRADRVILIDAADMRKPPGEARTLDSVLLEDSTKVRFSSLHGIGVAEVLALGRAVGVEPTVTILAIQPADIRPRDGLSEALAARVPEYVELAEGLLASDRERDFPVDAGQGSDTIG
jgi:hydrogenase maturation protease